MDPRLKPYRSRSGFIVPWQAELLAAWRIVQRTQVPVRLSDALSKHLGTDPLAEAWMFP